LGKNIKETNKGIIFAIFILVADRNIVEAWKNMYKLIKKLIIILVIAIPFIVGDASAQPPPPPKPKPIPIDGGLGVLIVAGLIYGGYKLRSEKDTPVK
jgi:hypothetical protein